MRNFLGFASICSICSPRWRKSKTVSRPSFQTRTPWSHSSDTRSTSCSSRQAAVTELVAAAAGPVRATTAQGAQPVWIDIGRVRPEFTAASGSTSGRSAPRLPPLPPLLVNRSRSFSTATAAAVAATLLSNQQSAATTTIAMAWGLSAVRPWAQKKTARPILLPRIPGPRWDWPSAPQIPAQSPRAKQLLRRPTTSPKAFWKSAPATAAWTATRPHRSLRICSVWSTPKTRAPCPILVTTKTCSSWSRPTRLRQTQLLPMTAVPPRPSAPSLRRRATAAGRATNPTRQVWRRSLPWVGLGWEEVTTVETARSMPRMTPVSSTSVQRLCLLP